MNLIDNLKQKLLSVKAQSVQESDLNSKQVLSKQVIISIVLFGAVVVTMVAFLKIGSSKHDKASLADGQKLSPSKIEVEIASKALDPDRMWRNHFEDKLQDAQQTTNQQLAKISAAIEAKSQETLNQTKDDIKELRNQLKAAKEQLEEATNEMRELRLSAKQPDKDFEYVSEGDLQSILIDDETGILLPRDSKMYIPETGYIEGTLLGGISVSTSVGSSSEPVPVVVRITGKGNLPSNFAANLKDCRVLGSSYGDLSSERAVIRAESLVCVNQETEEIVTTKIAGVVYGDDGMNGVKGKVVDMSTKHIKNAAIGGILSGFASSMKSEGQFTLSSLGAINTKQQGFDGRLKDNAAAGLGSAAEKIADYYIKQAENMSPVLLIPGGSKVDIVFTKGVYLGSSDVIKQIESDRKKLADQVR